MKNYVITIARGFGTGGKQIAMALADDLGIECYEHRILTLASQLSGYDEKEFLENNENLGHSLLLSKLAALPAQFAIRPENRNFWEFRNEHMKYYKYQETIIRNLAETESCVIVGKCADHILKNYDNVISIYIEAPRYFCVQRIMQKMHISEAEAHKLIEKTDRYRADYYEFYTGGNYWTNPVNYDLTINSARVGKVDDLSGCVRVIEDYLYQKFGIRPHQPAN